MSASRPSPRTRRFVPLLAVGAVLMSMTVGVAAAAAHPHSRTTMVRVPQGSAVAPLAAGTDVGATAASTPIDLSFILRSPRLQNLESRVAAGWDGPFLTTVQFANQYGQTPAVVHAIEHYLARFGITSHAFADRLDISPTAPQHRSRRRWAYRCGTSGSGPPRWRRPATATGRPCTAACVTPRSPGSSPTRSSRSWA
jgi:hypothetical protein